MNTVRLSKLLSLVLRHDPGKIGLELDPLGWAGVEELLSCLARSGQAVSRAELERVVAENNKQRFRFSDNGQRIRANQGHSLPVELNLEPRDPPEVLYHGTATRFLESILASGLRKGNRHHVHLSSDRETAREVGRRHGRPLVLIVRAARMRLDGHEFYLSHNGVWLVAHVPAGYLAQVD